MNTVDDDTDDAALEALFDRARAAPPRVPDALMARVLADADAHQPRARRSWRGWLRAIGGAPALGGLVTAACVGFWIGVAPPSGVPDIAGAVITDQFDTVDYEAAAADVDVFGWDQDEG